VYVALASYNTGYLTLPMKSIENLVDAAAQVAILDKDGVIVRHGHSNRRIGGGGKGKSSSRSHSRNSSTGSRFGATFTVGGNNVDWESLWNEGTDAVMDVPIGGVNEILYGVERDYEE